MPDAIYIAGPTASGKSSAALSLAQSIGGEIISVDSMQVYRGMDIGTAKPSAEERRAVPHHLIDAADIADPFDAARFVSLARQAHEDICARGRIPIYCGGTGLYFNALLAGIGTGPPASAELRKTLQDQPLQELLDELRLKDPASFEQMDRSNPRRVIRAVEIIRLAGRPCSTLRSDWAAARSGAHLYGIERDRTDLHNRINARVDAMFAAGLVEETRELLGRGLGENPTALQAIGYRQVAEYLRGERALPETIELVKQKTRQYAKRQMTWFRRQLSVFWISAAPADSAEALAGKIAALSRRQRCEQSPDDPRH